MIEPITTEKQIEQPLQEQDSRALPCSACDGRGWNPADTGDGRSDNELIKEDCQACDGSGDDYTLKPCPRCKSFDLARVEGTLLFHFVVCNNCGRQTQPHLSSDYADEAWNERRSLRF